VVHLYFVTFFYKIETTVETILVSSFQNKKYENHLACGLYLDEKYDKIEATGEVIYLLL
jgi:hypothetical protein